MLKTKAIISFPTYLIAIYFILNGLGNILSTIAYISLSYPNLENTLNGFRFMYVDLPGIQSNDPFIAAVINGIPIYNNFFIYLKDLFIIIVFILAGYSLSKMKKLGYRLGLFISIFGLLVGTSYGFRHNPIEYLQSILGGVQTFGFNDLSWIVMALSFLITLFTPFYLILNRKLFTK